MYTLVNFEIKRIYAGWFDVLFKTEKDEATVTASDAWGNDSPRLFLQILFELLHKQVYNKYVIWDEEPGVYIIFIDKMEDLYNIKIAFSEFSHDELFADIRNVMGDISYEEMSSKLKDLELILECNNVDYVYLLRTVVRAFEEYENSAVYQENWMDFPYKELAKCKHYLKTIL